MSWIVVALVTGLCSALPSVAQEKKVLSLKEAIDLSVKNSKQLKNSRAQIDEASAAVREATERKLPDASASASYLRVNSPNVDVKIKSNNNSGGTTNEPAKVSQAAYGILNATLPLYTASRIRFGIESAKYLEQAVKLDADNNREEVVINTIDAYNNLYKSKAAADLVQESLEGARQRVKEFANLEKNGVLARNDYLKAELQASNTELSLLDAQNNFKLATINMNLMLGLPENTELITDSVSLVQAAEIKGVEDYVQAGLQKRTDLSALSYRRKAAGMSIKATEAEKYPNIALTGGYVAIDVPHALVVTNAVNLGVGVQYSLSSLWKTKSKVEGARARERQISANEELLTDAIRLQVNQAYQNYLLSRKKIDVYTTAVAQATENFKIVRNKYTNGLATVTDLLDADVAQLQSKLNFAFAQSDATVSYNKLLQTAGLLTNQ
jgi:outer membrane protein TolC